MKKQKIKSLKNSKTKVILYSIGYFLFLALLYYIFLPPFNLRSVKTYFYLLPILAYVVGLIYYFIFHKKQHQPHSGTYQTYRYHPISKTFVKEARPLSEKYHGARLFRIGAMYTALGMLAMIIIFALTGATLFNAKRYAGQLSVRTGTLEEMNNVFDYEDGDVQLPLIDKDLAFKLAQAKLGDYGAQYTLDYNNFTLISVHRNGKDDLIRVAPLEYANFFVSLNKINEGTIGYIEVNVITKETKLVTFRDGLKYMPSGILAKDLDRHIRFHHPTELYQNKFFEIDNAGNPFWVVPTYKKAIGMFGGKTPKGVIVVDPISGQMTNYRLGEEPEWVQRCVDEGVIEQQANNALRYKNGFFNAVIGERREVFQLSDGYNYFLKNGNTYYVSCITSPNEADQTSIGFIAINLKTKEATRYASQGITEMRAREIAEMDERVKAQKLEATWPILISYHNIPTYFLVLKNDVQDQKVVYVNVENGTLVAMGNNIKEAQQEYERLLANSGTSEKDDLTVEGTVVRMRDLGSTIEFTIENKPNEYFVVNVAVSIDARFLTIGDQVSLVYKNYGTYNYVTNLTILR